MHIQFKNSISNILIVFSLVATVAVLLNQGLYYFGMNRDFLLEKNYLGLSLQFLCYQFLHGGLLHLASNSIFLYIFGNQIEYYIGKKYYFTLFVLNTFFVGACLLIFSDGNTVGISGFAMALLSFYILELKRIRDPNFRGAALMLLINIGVGLDPRISLIGHLAGAVIGGIFWYIIHQIERRKFIGSL